MKKIILASVLCAVNMLAIAQPITFGYSRSMVITNNFNNGFNNLSSLVGCPDINEAQTNMLSRINLQNKICLYESYSKLTEKWVNNGPDQYIPPRSVVITLNKQEVSDEEKERLKKTSQVCQDISTKLREKLKDMYSVDNLVCK